MKSAFYLILFFICNWAWSASKDLFPKVGDNVYVNNVEDGQYITVFNKAGLNWKNCKTETDAATGDKKCIDAVGWLDSTIQEIKVTGKPELHPTVNPISGKKENQYYIKVFFAYSRKGVLQFAEGYVEAFNLSKKKLPTFFGPKENVEPAPILPKPSPAVPPAKETNSCSSTVAAKSIKEACEPIEQVANIVLNLNVQKTAAQLSSIVGFCAVTPGNNPPSNLPPGNLYDSLIFSKLKKMKVPRLANEDGVPMSRDDLVNIDSMARTLYGEMARCYRYGLQYPMTVAKVIVNRTQQAKENKGKMKLFVRKPHDSEKPLLSQVTTTPSQFSMWHRSHIEKGVRKHNGPLYQGMCPPQIKGGPFYAGQSASKFEYDIWENTMRIATEAILFPKRFKRRTAAIVDTNYTSGLSHYRDKKLQDIPKPVRFIKNMTQVNPQIEGRVVDRDECVELWKD